jgi:hypothetical protein
MMPRSSVQASKTGDDTKSSQIPSKDDLVREATVRVICVAAAVGIYLYLGCHTKYFNTVPQYLFIWACFTLGQVSVQNLMDQSQLLDEIKKLKEEIQIKSSEKPQVKADEKAQDIKEPKPRKDRVKDQAVTINCLEDEQKNSSPVNSAKKIQDTKEHVKKNESVGKQLGGKGSDDSKVEMAKYEKASRIWKHSLAAIEKGIKPKNPVCGAKKFQTFYVGNLKIRVGRVF